MLQSSLHTCDDMPFEYTHYLHRDDMLNFDFVWKSNTHQCTAKQNYYFTRHVSLCLSLHFFISSLFFFDNDRGGQLVTVPAGCCLSMWENNNNQLLPSLICLRCNDKTIKCSEQHGFKWEMMFTLQSTACLPEENLWKFVQRDRWFCKKMESVHKTYQWTNVSNINP